MTEDTKLQIGRLGIEIADYEREARRLRGQLDEIEQKMADLDAKRWQLILTN